VPGDFAGRYGAVNVAGVVLSTDSTGSAFNVIQVDSAALNLGPLADDGGPTMTLAVLTGNVAI
jgi:hypothetical protein